MRPAGGLGPRPIGGASATGAPGATGAGADTLGIGSAAAGAAELVRLLRTGAGGRPLVRPTDAGPTVSNPVAASDLRVLGGSSSPMAAPDPTGAVSPTPPPPSVIERAVPVARAAPQPAPRQVDRPTPRQRWEAAVAARPLEAPRELPTALRQMAQSIVGRAVAPRYTTGPATRHALGAAGALGATTGSVVHLPAAPTTAPSSVSVLAHELTHARSPVSRPRFFLGRHTAHLDDDERRALAAGASILGASHGPGETFSAGGLPGMGPAGIPGGQSAGPAVTGMPGTTSLAGLATGGRAGAGVGSGRLAGGGVAGAASGGGGLAGGGLGGTAFGGGGLAGAGLAGAALGGGGLAGAALGSGGLGGTDGLPGALGAAARDAAGDTNGVAAGIVDGLPVGGGVGAVADLATSTARQTVLAAMPGGQVPSFPGSSGGYPGGGTSGGGPGGGYAGEPGGSAGGGFAGGVPGGFASGGGGGFEGGGFGGGGFEGGAGGNAGGGGFTSGGTSVGASGGGAGAGGPGAHSGGPTGSPGAGTSGRPQGAPGLASLGGDVPHTGAIDTDRIVEMVEERLLREIERRGGRWAGVF